MKRKHDSNQPESDSNKRLKEQPEPPPNFVIDPAIAKKSTYGTKSQTLLDFFTGTLGKLAEKQRDILLTLLRADKKICQVEFYSGTIRDKLAPAETLLLVQIDEPFILLEDLEDVLMCNSFPWNKVNKGTCFKVQIKLSPKWLQKAGQPSNQLGDLIHEYTLHGIPNARFMTFVQSVDDPSGGTVAFYYFYHSRPDRERYLDTIYQHSSHGPKAGEPVDPQATVWNDWSGNKDYNTLINLFLPKVSYERELIRAAIADINKQLRDPSAPVKTPQESEVTVQGLLKLPVKPGTLYALLREVAICSYGKDESAPESILATLQKYPDFSKEKWGILLNSCYSFFKYLSGDLFGLDKKRIDNVLQLAEGKKSSASGKVVYTLVYPQPRELLEAWIVYVAYSCYDLNTGDCKKIADEVASELTEGDWQALQDYTTYRALLGELLQDKDESEAWKKAEKELPDRKKTFPKKDAQ